MSTKHSVINFWRCENLSKLCLQSCICCYGSFRIDHMAPLKRTICSLFFPTTADVIISQGWDGSLLCICDLFTSASKSVNSWHLFLPPFKFLYMNMAACARGVEEYTHRCVMVQNSATPCYYWFDLHFCFNETVKVFIFLIVNHFILCIFRTNFQHPYFKSSGESIDVCV